MSLGPTTASAAASFAAANVSRTASPLPAPHSLRILLVDDNHINLSVLSTLLKRRFGHVLARPPVSLDSGLKALQLLRTQIFDLIFMDIEMPYLNGVECARRVRAGEDGILPANRNAHIVAVTTNCGAEPASLYRHVGMDGMISKPVRFHNFQQYLCPLSIEAREAQGSVTPVLVGTEEMMPPMPPVDLEERLFFIPTANGSVANTSKSGKRDCASPTLEYSHGNEFAAMLKAQTIKSLRDRKALSISRSTTVSGERRSSFNSPRSEHLPTIGQLQQSTSADMANAVSRTETDENVQTTQQDHDSARGSVTGPILSFRSLVERETREREQDCKLERRAPLPVRPVPIHRISSPAYMLDASPIGRLRAESGMHSDPDLGQQAVRPNIRPLPVKQARRRDSDDSENGSTDNADVDDPASSAWSNHAFSSGYTTSTQRSVSSELLTSFSSHRATSPSSSVTTPISSPADMDRLTNGKDGDEDADDIRKAVFSPCADDMLMPRGAGLGFLDAPPLPALPPLSKALSLQNSPRIFVRGIDDDDVKPHRRGDLLPRMEALHLDQPQTRSPPRELAGGGDA